MKLYIETSGDGPDLVLLHGWGMHGGVWDGVRDELGRRFRVHVADLPGYGESGVCAPYALENIADALAAALPPRVMVCGWSLGGQVALTWALRRPEQVGRLALVGATPSFVRREDWPHGIEPQVLRDFGASLELDYQGTLLRFLSLQARCGEAAREVMKRLRGSLFARGRPAPETLRAGLDILLDSDLRDRVAEVGAPTLALHGAHDTLAPEGAARWLARHLPQAQLEIVPGCAHAPFLSHPQAFLRAVTDFFHES